MTSIVLSDKHGNAICELSETAEAVIAIAEDDARQTGQTKRQCLVNAFKASIEAEGYKLSAAELQAAMRIVDAIRGGKPISEIRFAVDVRQGQRAAKTGNRRNARLRNEQPKMARATKASGFRFFEDERLYPDDNAEWWFERLVGIDQHKQTLLLELELLLKPELVEQWSKAHHKTLLPACEIMTTRVPLLVLEGDVGCGKTVLAESVGDPLAKRLGCHVHLLKINTQVRGSGMVGEMTDLIAQAFTSVEEKARRNSGEPVLLLIDEADSLASKRAEQHMHHEDKAGVNTLLQRIDRLRREGLRVVVIFITNRPDALDAAIRRRAALSIRFERPNDDARAELFRRNFPDLAMNGTKMKKLVTATGSTSGSQVAFTASDITDRLIPDAIKQAYLNKSPVTVDLLLASAQRLQPTPPIEDS